MENMKAQIECKLVAIQLEDLCKHKEGIIYDASLSTQERVIRFQTPILKSIFPNTTEKNSVWKTGCFVMYEIYNDLDALKITCSVSYKGLLQKQIKSFKKLIEKCDAVEAEITGLFFIREWNYPHIAENMYKRVELVQDFFEIEMPYFENELLKWKENEEYHIKTFPEISDVLVRRDELPEEIFLEGGMKDILTNKYERNIVARKKCLAFYGTSCNICGLDFGVVYGCQFAGKIHVHHKIPLYEIGKEYIVDPIKDLIPVCPNCHMILHSKTNGVYTIEEVKEMLSKE